MSNQALLERAFALAESGTVQNIAEIRSKLMEEGYTRWEVGQLRARTLSKQLLETIAAAGRQC